MKEHKRFKGIDHRVADQRQRTREAMLVAQDNADRRIEELRVKAEADALEGKVANLQDTVVAPTPEWQRHGETVPYTPRGRDGIVKTVKTVRRRLYDAVRHLEGRGVLDAEQAHACRWFRDLHEAAQIERPCSISSYGETIRGDVLFGHLPVSEWAARARQEYRSARELLPVGSSTSFDAVVLRNLPLERAARVAGKHRNIVKAKVQTVSTILAVQLKSRRTDENAR